VTTTAPPVATTAARDALAASRRARRRRRALVTAALVVLVVALALVALMVGEKLVPLGDVVRVALGQTVPGATFTVGELRLPRTATAVLAGFAFGAGGVTFQTMLRNPLASPDIIGISSGASVAAVFGILVLGVSGPTLSAMAVVLGLATALLIYVLAYRDGLLGARLVLVGIGVGAFLHAMVPWMLLRASAWDLPAAIRWLTGSLNEASWEQLRPLAIAVVLVGPLMVLASRPLAVLQLGDDAATGLGVRVERTRLLLLVGAVVLISFATATTGPIAFLAFLAGPIAARLVGPGATLVLPAGLVGAALTLAADLIGQHAFDTRFPVGVVTGAIGAPYLVYLLIRSNRAGGSL